MDYKNMNDITNALKLWNIPKLLVIKWHYMRSALIFTDEEGCRI